MKVVLVTSIGFYLPEDVEEKLKKKGYTSNDICCDDKKFRVNKDLIDALYEHGVDTNGHVIDELLCIVDIPDNTTDFAIQSDESDWGEGIEILWYVVDGKLHNTYWLKDQEEKEDEN